MDQSSATKSKVTLLRLTSMCDTSVILSDIYRGHEVDLWTTWVGYTDDPATQSIFASRMASHTSEGHTTHIGNDPHTLQALTNVQARGDLLVVDGLHLLTSNIMLRTNSDEDYTQAVAAQMIGKELAFLKCVDTLGYASVLIISSDIGHDLSLATFQGKTYRGLLNFTNRTALKLLPQARSLIGTSGGFMEEPR